MRRHRLGAIAMIGAMLVGTALAAAAPEQHRGGGRAGAPGGAAHPGHGQHRGPVAGSRPGRPHVAPPARGLPRGGHYSGTRGQWGAHPAWRGAGEFNRWRGGHWWHGTYTGRLGWWWIVGPDWYWYPTQVAPIPDPYTPPGMASGYWYWCDTYRQYYPYVGACPVPWRAVLPQ